MITLSLLTLAALWIVVLYRFPAYFVPRKSIGLGQDTYYIGESWIDATPTSRHHDAPSMQEVG